MNILREYRDLKAGNRVFHNGFWRTVISCEGGTLFVEPMEVPHGFLDEIYKVEPHKMMIVRE
jgi:hypothetical protein